MLLLPQLLIEKFDTKLPSQKRQIGHLQKEDFEKKFFDKLTQCLMASNYSNK